MAGIPRAGSFADTKVWGFGAQKGKEGSFRDGCSANNSSKAGTTKNTTASQVPPANPL